jgi:hypothetical protein
MTQKDAIYLLVQSVKHAHQMGSFSIGESEVISKAIRVISKSTEEPTENS